MSTGATTAYSYRVNEIRLSEVGPQVGKAEQFEVVVLNEAGAERYIAVAIGPKWGARGWRGELRCEGCVGTARVLRVVNDHAFCGTCLPNVSQHHLHKNSTHWRAEGEVVHAIIRSVLKPKSSRSACRMRQRLAARLKRNVLSYATLVTENAERLIKAVDSL